MDGTEYAIKVWKQAEAASATMEDEEVCLVLLDAMIAFLRLRNRGLTAAQLLRHLADRIERPGVLQ